MDIEIRIGTKSESPALRQFVEHALIRKLGTRSARIRRARLRLDDVNGPRRGIDKLCHVRLDVSGGGEIHANGKSSGWYEAVSIAVMNARAALDHRLGRLKSRHGRDEAHFEDSSRIELEQRRQLG